MLANAVLPAHQARSRESLRKLLDAARVILGHYGIDGATVPRIARHAGLTPGSVYRRFQDKEALLESAILEILERQEETMKTSLTQLATNQTRPVPQTSGPTALRTWSTKPTKVVHSARATLMGTKLFGGRCISACSPWLEPAS